MKKSLRFADHVRSTREGNVFTRVCPFTEGVEYILPGEGGGGWVCPVWWGGGGYVLSIPSLRGGYILSRGVCHVQVPYRGGNQWGWEEVP